MATKLEIAIGNASSADMYSYLMGVNYSGNCFVHDPLGFQVKEFLDQVGYEAANSEQSRDKLIELVEYAHDWSTDAYNDGEQDYYPNLKHSFLTFMEKDNEAYR